MNKRTKRWIAVASLWGMLAGGMATAASGPPIRILIGYPPGNLTDTVARLLAKRLSEKWQRPFIVENRPGAGSSLAPRAVASSSNDGTVLLITGQAAIIANPHMYSDVGYKPFEDFEFVNSLIWTPYVCSVSKDLNITSLKDLISYSKAHPGKVSYGSPGIGTTSHMIMEAMRGKFGLDATHVPYKGSTAVVSDLVAGRIQMACEPPSAMAAFILDKRIVPVAVTSRKRVASLPKLPTVEEQTSEFMMGAWVGVLSPKGTRKDFVERLAKDITDVMNEPEIKSTLAKQDVDVVTPGPAEFRAQAAKDSELYGAIIRRQGIKAD